MGIRDLSGGESGVPILGWQLLLSMSIGLIFLQFEKKILGRLGKKTNIALFILIFLSCGVFWSFTPLNPSFWNPAPYPPNYIYYPSSDAATFDLHAQSTLVGNGFNQGRPLDRPFYPMLLAIIHLLSGQTYTNNMMLQAFLFGIFPAIVFLICSELGSRSWGVMTASAIGFLGSNAILESNMFTATNPKNMMTEFPLAIMLSLLLYFSIRWLKSETHSGIFACIVGGLLAGAAYIRYAALPLLPIWIIVTFIKYRSVYKKGLIEAGLIIASFLVFTAPWYIRNVTVGKGLSIPFSNKIMFVIDTRYKWPSGIIPSTTETPVEEAIATQPATRAASNDQTDPIQPQDSIIEPLSESIWYRFPPHLIHNIMGSIFILPTSYEMASLKTSLTLGGEIWKPRWDGSLSSIRVIFLILQFIVLAAGFAGFFRKEKAAAVITILIFLCIQTANALGRTSGGRYLVPADWLVLLFYFAGFLYLIGKLDLNRNIAPGNGPGKSPGWRGVAITLMVVLLIGALPVIFERISVAIFQRTDIARPVETLAFVSESRHPRPGYRPDRSIPR